MKIINEKGQIAGKISIIDIIAFFIIIFIVIGGFSSFRLYKKKQQELEQQKILEEKNKIQSIQSEEGFYLLTHIPQDIVGKIQPGNLTEHFEILKIISIEQELAYHSQLPDTKINIYQKDSANFHAIIQAKIDFYIYQKDSVFFQDKRIYPNQPFNVTVDGKNFQISKINYSLDSYETSQVFTIRNVPENIGKQLFKKGTIIKNSFMEPLAEIKELIMTSQSEKSIEISSKRYNLTSKNLDYTVFIHFFLKNIQGQYYYDLSIFQNQLYGYLQQDNDWYYLDFQLQTFTEKQAPVHHLQVPLIIHGLTKKEVKELKTNTKIIGKKGQPIGEIVRIEQDYLHDFYFNSSYIRKNFFSIAPNHDLYKIKCIANLETSMSGLNYMIEDQRFYSYQALQLNLSFLFKSHFIQKTTEIITSEIEPKQKTICAIEFFSYEDLENGSLILNPNDGFTIMGKIIKPLTNNTYLTEMNLNPIKNHLSYFNQFISYTYEYPFLIYNKNSIHFLYGAFLPETHAEFKFLLPLKGTIDSSGFNSINQYSHNSFQIKKIENNEKFPDQLELTITGKLYHPCPEYWYIQTSNSPITLNQANSTLISFGQNIVGTFLHIKEIK